MITELFGFSIKREKKKNVALMMHSSFLLQFYSNFREFMNHDRYRRVLFQINGEKGAARVDKLTRKNC